MLKRSLVLLFGSIFAYAGVQKVELIAEDVSKKGEIVEAKGDVVIYSQDYFITADRALYDEKGEVIELFGNVNAMKGKNEVSRGNYLKIDLKNSVENSAENFLMDTDAEIWMQNDSSCSDKKYYKTKGSIVSSCNVSDPDWQIKYTSGMLNKESKFLHLFNPRFYLGGYPVLYLPYFGFPTDDTRRTGLLIPEAGYIKKEGFYYKQPIYFAPYDSWDLQLDPQIRTRRGSGIYATFRFKDSPYSYGEIRGGLFNNHTRNQARLELKNEKHHGFEVEYERSKLAKYLIDGNFKENLWIDFTRLNDLEYYDLVDKGGVGNSSDNSLVTSRLNYYLTTDNHYFGTYARYYIDTSKLNSGNVFKDNDTVQEIPTLHYHKFIDSLFVPNLLYSFDIKAHNYTRKEGAEVIHYEANLPVKFTTPLLGDYLNFTFTENFYLSHLDWSGNYIYKNGEFRDDSTSTYLNNYHLLSLSSDLAKAYDSFYHTMALGVDYLIPGLQKGGIEERVLKKYKYDYDRSIGRARDNRLLNLADNLYYEDNFISELNDEFTRENMAFKFTQYFYDQNGRKFIRHAVKQRYDLESSEFATLDHRIDFYLKNGLNFGNRFEYSHKFDSFDKVQSYIRYANSSFSTSLTHSYEYEKLSEDRSKYSKDNYAILNASINLPNYYKLFGALEYDMNLEYNKMWRLGLTHNKKCWNYTLVYQEDIEPKNTSNKEYVKAKKQQGIYLFVNFYPFGGIGYDYSHDKEYLGNDK